MKIPNRCPFCGSPRWKQIAVYHDGFSFWKSVLWRPFIGRRLSLLLGMGGRKKRVYICQDCGLQMDYE